MMESSDSMYITPVMGTINGCEPASVKDVGRAFIPYLKSLTAIWCFDRFYNRCHKQFLRK